MIILKGHKGQSIRFEFTRDKKSLPIFLKDGDCILVRLEIKVQHRPNWIQRISRAKVFSEYPRDLYGEKYPLEIELLDQPTALNKVPEIKDGHKQ